MGNRAAAPQGHRLLGLDTRRATWMDCGHSNRMDCSDSDRMESLAVRAIDAYTHFAVGTMCAMGVTDIQGYWGAGVLECSSIGM